MGGVQMAKKQERLKNTALYEHLSKDDEQKGESNSITNQKQYLKYYVWKHEFQYICYISGFCGKILNDVMNIEIDNLIRR